MTSYFRIAIPTPLRRYFDYLPPQGFQGKMPAAGIRIRVPFGRQTLIGVLLEIVHATDVPTQKLKAALEILDQQPVFDTELLQLLKWCGQYYHHPIGEVIQNALPVKLRQGASTQIKSITRWQLTAQGHALEPGKLPCCMI